MARRDSYAQVWRDVSKEISEEMEDILDTLAPNGVLVDYEMKPPEERAMAYFRVPMPDPNIPGSDMGTYPGDLPTILDPKGLEKMRLGILPLVESPYWRDLLVMPKYYEMFSKDVRELYKQGLAKLAAV